jgi:hypothetical protein
MNPTDPFPIAIRAAFIFEKNAAATGQEAEVPAMPTVTPNADPAEGIRTMYIAPAKLISG